MCTYILEFLDFASAFTNDTSGQTLMQQHPQFIFLDITLWFLLNKQKNKTINIIIFHIGAENAQPFKHPPKNKLCSLCCTLATLGCVTICHTN